MPAQAGLAFEMSSSREKLVFEPSEARVFVETYLSHQDIQIGFDGSVSYRTQRTKGARDEDELLSLLTAVRLTPQLLLDQIVDAADGSGASFSRAKLAAALRMIVNEQLRARKSAVVAPLFARVPVEESERALAEWRRLGSLFDIDAALATAIFQHFIWRVKRKLSKNETPAYQRLPLVIGKSGTNDHTLFVREFLSPLRELVFEASQLSDFSQAQSDDVFRFPVLLLTDLAPVAHAKLAILRRLLASGFAHSRRFSARIENELTPIITSTSRLEDLLPSAIDYHRFVAMSYIGQPAESATIEPIDYTLLWRSVDALPQEGISIAEADPLYPFQDDLDRLLTDSAQPRFLEWLNELDISSENIMNVTNPRGVSAMGLRNDYIEKTGDTVSQFRFSKLMDEYSVHPKMPFSSKRRWPDGYRYALKPAKTNRPTNV